MTTLTLKSYQQSALDALAAYARAARIQGPAAAFAQHAGRAYNADAFGPEVPCVCLRAGQRLLPGLSRAQRGHRWPGRPGPIAGRT